MFRQLTHKTLAAALAALALAAPAVAQTTAQTATQTAGKSATIQIESVKVAYDDLDISRDAGARVLLVRIEQAARRICGDRPAPRLVTANLRHQSCIGSAVSGAVSHVNSPRLTALFNDETQPLRVASR